MQQFEQLWREVEESGGKPDIFDFFGLPDSADPFDVDFTGIKHLKNYKNYAKQQKQLLESFIPFIRKTGAKKKNKTKVVLIVAAAGDGKTTFIKYFENSFFQMIKRGKLKPAEYDFPKIGMGLSAKYLSLKDFLKQLERDEKRFGFYEEKEKQIIMFEDLQDLFCPIRSEKKEKEREDFFNRINKYKNCFVIITSTPFNWLELKQLNQEVEYFFDERIFLNGLNEEHLREIVGERVFTFQKNQEIFPAPLRERVISESGKNPRLCLAFFYYCFEAAFLDKSKVVQEKHLEIASKKVGLHLVKKINLLPKAKQELLKELTSIREMSATDISEKTTLNRTTISQYLNELERRGFTKKREAKKKVYYSLPAHIRNYLEKEMVEKTE